MAEGQRSDHLSVLRGGHCYRMLGVGGAEVEDMDLFLFDPEGVQMQQDRGAGPLPRARACRPSICPPYSGAYRLQVHMYKGGGAVALQAYTRTP